MYMTLLGGHHFFMDPIEVSSLKILNKKTFNVLQILNLFLQQNISQTIFSDIIIFGYVKLILWLGLQFLN
jgi:hypothetical protein